MEPRNQIVVRPDGVAEVTLTRGKVALIDEADIPLIAPHRWWSRKLKGKDMWYASAEERMVARRRGETLQMHRVIMGLTVPEQLVDHRNFDGLDNQRSNLRPCNKGQNTAYCRRQINNTSGYIGVDYRPDCHGWRAHIGVRGRFIHLGMFRSAEDAARRRDQAAIEYFGEFAFLNFRELLTGPVELTGESLEVVS